MSANVEQFSEHLSAHQGRLRACIFSLVPRLGGVRRSGRCSE